MNEYLRRYACQTRSRGGAITFVAVDPTRPTEILGYYTISPGAVDFSSVPPDLTKGLGHHEVPVFRLGRLAVRRDLQGHGLGTELLLAAGARGLSAAAEVGGVALAIDAKDERSATWYEKKQGALRLLDDPLKLLLPLETIAQALKGARR